MKNTISICGRHATLAPYTEKKRFHLDEANTLVRTYLDDHASEQWTEMDDEAKQSFWKRKADILIEGGVSEAEVASDEFEYGLLAEAERFFTMRQAKVLSLPKNTSDIRTTSHLGRCRTDARACGFGASERTATMPTSLQGLTP